MQTCGQRLAVGAATLQIKVSPRSAVWVVGICSLPENEELWAHRKREDVIDSLLSASCTKRCV